MVAVKDCYSFRVCHQKLWDLFADDEEDIEGRSLVVFPLEANDVLKLSLFNVAATDIDSDVFILMRILQELPDGVHGIPIKLLNPWGRESHSDYACCDICEVEVVSILFETIFGAANYLSQEVHFITSIQWETFMLNWRVG